MHLVIGFESCKTIFRMVIQAMGKIERLPIQIRDTQCSMVFMVVDTNNCDILLGLDFLIKIGVVVDIEYGLIQVKQRSGFNAGSTTKHGQHVTNGDK